MDVHILETFNRHLRRDACPPWLLRKDYRDVCSYFIPADAEEAACDFHISELFHAIFYIMVVHEALELDILSRNRAEDLKSAHIGLL